MKSMRSICTGSLCALILMLSVTYPLSAVAGHDAGFSDVYHDVFSEGSRTSEGTDSGTQSGASPEDHSDAYPAAGSAPLDALGSAIERGEEDFQGCGTNPSPTGIIFLSWVAFALFLRRRSA